MAARHGSERKRNTLVASASSSLSDVCERLKRVAPEVLDLATATTEAEFCAAFDALLERAVRQLEENAEDLASLTEVGLSAFVCGCLMDTEFGQHERDTQTGTLT